MLWLDEQRFTTPGYLNAQEIGGEWLIVPVRREGQRARICDVTVAGEEWRDQHLARLAKLPAPQAIVEALWESWDATPLSVLNLTLTGHLLEAHGIKVEQARQSEYHLGGKSISERLVRTIKALGGDTYLSGPGGWRYLDPEVFKREAIELRFHSHNGPNPSGVELVPASC